MELTRVYEIEYVHEFGETVYEDVARKRLAQGFPVRTRLVSEWEPYPPVPPLLPASIMRKIDEINARHGVSYDNPARLY